MYPKNWMKEVLLLPFLLALGIGMSINNGKAVLEALFNMESPFVRTPKYGILRNGQSWRRSSYSAMKSLALVFELILALYFSYLTLFSIAADIWSSVPFMMLFTFGFWYVAIGSLMQLIPPSWLSSNKPIAEAVATVV